MGGKLAVAAALVVVGWVGGSGESSARARAGGSRAPFARYEACDEFAGLGLVPSSGVRARVPSEFTLVEPQPGQAMVVAQAARCEGIRLGRGRPRPGAFAQLGVAIAPPDGSSDAAFYQLAFATDHAELARALAQAGVAARWSRGLRYAIDEAEGALAVRVPAPEPFAWQLRGAIELPDPRAAPNPVTTFNYWGRSKRFGPVLQSNVVSGIRLGSSNGVVLTARGRALRAALGAETLEFSVFASPEVFDSAELSVRAAPAR